MLHAPPIKHCRACGAAVAYRLPDDGDTHQRAVCTVCHTIHYQNPLNVVGTICTWENKVLLCLRNIEPRKGKWTLPAGFMELQETTQQGALRETVEEAGALVALDQFALFSMVSVPVVGQVHIFYRTPLLSSQFNPGLETLEARLFSEHEVPWNELAFRTVKTTLERFFADRSRGHFGVHDYALS